MAAITLNRILPQIDLLSSDDQKSLEEHLRQRRVEAWKKETAAEAKKALAAARAGKLKSKSVAEIMACLDRDK